GFPAKNEAAVRRDIQRLHNVDASAAVGPFPQDISTGIQAREKKLVIDVINVSRSANDNAAVRQRLQVPKALRSPSADGFLPNFVSVRVQTDDPGIPIIAI